MREKIVCRHCHSSRLGNFGASSGRRPFSIPGARPHYAPDLPFKLEHILIDVSVDPVGKKISGKVTQRAIVVAPGQDWLKLDQIGLNVEEVLLGDKQTVWRTEGNSLLLRLSEDRATAPKPGQAVEFTVRYHVIDPRRGLYFTGPDADYPAKTHQVWSQGQDEDSRYWFPTFDYPNQKATSEVIATVPKGYTAVSNGALLSKKETPEGTRYHYKLGTPHVTYLITLAVAEFSEWADEGPRRLPVQYFVAPGREEDGKRAFGNTPKMIEAYEKKIGVNYPYEKYSQVAVQDFIFGGMENTSATTQTDLTLHDARAHLDFSSDPLVSHELAHQWFGDLVTCRDWSHGWLNEGFATFMERVWIESDPGPNGGFEEAKYYSYIDLKEYLAEDRSSYRRPIVCNTYLEPIDLFDTHLYQKGGLVLNLIRHQLGDQLFWKTVQNYVKRHQGQNVETLDLIRAIEDTTGRNLRRFFDEWVFGAGYPEFEVSYQWHEEKKLAELTIEQKQTGGQPSVTNEGATTHLFHLPVTIELTLGSGEKITQAVEIGEARERVFLVASGRPVMVRFDPNHWIPKTLNFSRPKELLLYQLAKDPDCMGRIEAAKELVKIADREIVVALARAAASDSFWGVQVEAADALSEIHTDAARDALIAALTTKHPKARRGIARALGKFKDDLAAEALRKVAGKDESYYVEAEATRAWVSSLVRPVPRQSSAKPVFDMAEVEKALQTQLAKDSYREVIRGATLRALAELPGIARGEQPTAMQTLIDWSRRGHAADARIAAVDALGVIAREAVAAERARILSVFSQLAEEQDFRLRMALVAALEKSEMPDAIPLLNHIRETDPDGRVKRHAWVGIDRLETSGKAPESVSNLKAALQKLEEEHRKLKSLVEEQRATRVP